MAVAELGYKIESDGVKVAETRLRGMDDAARKADGSSDRLTKSSRGVSDGMARAARAIALATAAVTTFAAVLRGAETYTQLTNGLRSLGQSAEEAADSLMAVAEIANRTRSPLEATAKLYRRVSVAAGELGASQEDVLRFTENVGLALAASGTSANEASGALLQLSQAMAGGVVRAEEFNSILEGAFPIAQAAADGIEEAAGSVGKLRQMVIEGKVSSEEFFSAILSQTDAMEEAFANTVPTIGQAITVLGNNFTILSGTMDSALGLSSSIAKVVLSLANNLERLAVYAATASTAFGVFYVKGVVAAALATGTLSKALIFLRGALIRTGIGALVVLAGELIYQMLRLVSATGGWGNALTLLGDVASGVWDGIASAADGLSVALYSVWQDIKADFFEMVASLLEKWAQFVGTIAPALNAFSIATGNVFADWGRTADIATGVADSFGKAADDARENAVVMRDAAKTMTEEGFDKAADAVGKLRDAVKETSDAIAETPVLPELPPPPPPPNTPGAGGGGSDAGNTRIQQLIESLQTEREVVEQWYAQSQLDLIMATDAELELIGGRNEAKLRLEQEYQERLTGIRGAGENANLKNLSGFLGEAAGLMQSGNEKLFKIGKIAAIANAVVSGHSAAVAAWEKGMQAGGPPVAAAFAALSVAKTAAQISALRSSNFSGGGGGGGGGGGASAGSVAQPATQAPPQTRAIIQATGGRTRFTVDEINDIIAGIQKESKDGVIIEGFTS